MRFLIYLKRKVGPLLKSSYDISFTIWTFWKPATTQDIMKENTNISEENNPAETHFYSAVKVFHDLA